MGNVESAIGAGNGVGKAMVRGCRTPAFGSLGNTLRGQTDGISYAPSPPTTGGARDTRGLGSGGDVQHGKEE